MALYEKKRRHICAIIPIKAGVSPCRNRAEPPTPPGIWNHAPCLPRAFLPSCKCVWFSKPPYISDVYKQAPAALLGNHRRYNGHCVFFAGTQCPHSGLKCIGWAAEKEGTFGFLSKNLLASSAKHPLDFHYPRI